MLYALEMFNGRHRQYLQPAVGGWEASSSTFAVPDLSVHNSEKGRSLSGGCIKVMQRYECEGRGGRSAHVILTYHVERGWGRLTLQLIYMRLVWCWMRYDLPVSRSSILLLISATSGTPIDARSCLVCLPCPTNLSLIN